MNQIDLFEKLKNKLGIKDSIKLFDRANRGIYSDKPIEKNHVIIRIKSKYLLEFQRIEHLYPIDGIDNINSIVAFHLTRLFYEQDEFWSCYIDLLPQDISEFILFWNEQDLSLISNTSVEVDLQKHIESIDNDFTLIYLFNKQNNVVSYDIVSDDNLYSTWLRFRLLVGSRIFGYSKHGESISGIIPYIDMINHSIEPNTTWYYDNLSESFVLVSTKLIPPGNEIVDDYGVSNNLELLLYYGFTIKQNPKPILKFISGDIEYLFDTSFTLKNYETDKLNIIIEKIKKIYSHHMEILPKITNSNILQIYLDEIIVIKYLLKIMQVNFIQV